MADKMEFPKSVDEFMEQYKIIDSKKVYTNGSEFIPIFRMKQWFEHIDQMRWIPVTKRMPDADTEVWIQCETQSGNAYCCEAVYFPRWTKEAGYDQWDECSEYNEAEDSYYVIEGWYECIHNWDDYAFVRIEETVVAWMPLPATYKSGDTND